MSSPVYIMESEFESQRLEKKTDYAETNRQLELVGLKPGMKALDAGAGTGAVARVMADIVGTTGEVTAFDASECRLSQGANIAKEMGYKNVKYVSGDLYQPPLPKEHFDFIWCRFVFEYLVDPDLVMDRLLELLAPGGLLVVGDLDGNIVFHDGLDSETEATLHKVLGSFRDNFDPYAGRKLYGRFYKKNLRNIKVNCMPYHLFAGEMPERDISNWQGKLDGVRALGVKELGSIAEYGNFERKFMQFLRDPATFTYSVLFLVSGNKP